MKLLFIGARLFDDVAVYTKKMGITTVLTESNPRAQNLDLADSYHIVPRGMEHPKDIAIKEDVDGVVPLIGIDEPLKEVALLKEELETDHSLPVVASPLKAVSIAGDKVKTKQFLLKNNIKTPEHDLIHSCTQMGTKKYPLVLKQAHGQGGKDIKIALSQEDVCYYLEEYDTALVERFLEGIEISIEILRWKNDSIPLVPVSKGKTTLECIHPLKKLKKAPLRIDDAIKDAKTKQFSQNIRNIALNIANLLKIEGTADLDLIFDKYDKNTYVLEINTRISGTRYLTAASSDINPLHEMVDMATGSWNVNNVTKRIKEYCALEIPVGDYVSDKNNYRFREFHGENGWIIHGPDNHQRITIRGKDEKNAHKTATHLNLDLGNIRN
ncbi:MAG: ATP-grasp domain-containing protein [Methanobacterium sp.]|jgi:carbamoylphosphate synthase large subunit|nr:ATP-grasp domain-containing protein [Methanobacterium sp.]